MRVPNSYASGGKCFCRCERKGGGGGGVAGINRLLLEPAVRNSYASFNLANVFG